MTELEANYSKLSQYVSGAGGSNKAYMDVSGSLKVMLGLHRYEPISDCLGFCSVVEFPWGGDLLPNDLLHKTNYTLKKPVNGFCRGNQGRFFSTELADSGRSSGRGPSVRSKR